jgi:hypothetical protein
MPDEQILTWLKAKARVIDAQEELANMLDNVEYIVKSLRAQPSMPSDLKSWPDGSALAAALRECQEAERVFDGANAALSPVDRKLLKLVAET